MPDREKVIKGLDCCSKMVGEACRECPYANECEEEEGLVFGAVHLAADALVLLREQEQVQVSQYFDDTYGDYVNACECGNHWISIDGSLVNYCPGCGRKVKLE